MTTTDIECVSLDINFNNYNSWNNIFRKFKDHVKFDNKMSLDTFCQILNIDHKMGKRIIKEISEQENHYIVFEQYIKMVQIFIDGTENDKMSFLFNCLSENNMITKESLKSFVDITIKNETTIVNSNAIVNSLIPSDSIDKNGFMNMFETQHIKSAFLDSFIKNMLDMRIKKTPEINNKTIDIRTKGLLAIFLIFKSICYIYIFVDIYKQYSVISLALAKSFGFSLKINTTLLYIPMLRYLTTVMRESSFCNIKMKELIIFENFISYHSFIGYWTFFDIMGHVLCHIWNSVNSLSLLFYSSIGYTGIAIVICFMLIMIFAHLRHRFYNLFIIVHILTYLWIPFSIWHVPSQFTWYIPIIALIIIDKIILHCINENHLMTIPENTKQISDSIVNVSVFRGSTSVKVGGYFLICIPTISSIEWHPFSVASSPSDSKQISFMIRNIGDWTNKLYHHVDTNESFGIKLIGPFCSPSIDAIHCNKVLLMATGIGITPHISVIKYFFEMKKQTCLKCPDCDREVDSDLDITVTLIWSLRDIGCLDFIYNLFMDINQKQQTWLQKMFHIEIYITSLGNIGKLDYIFTQLSILKKFSFLESLKIHNTDQQSIYFCRPDIQKIIADIDKSTNVFFCGTKKVGNILKTLCINRKINYSQEMFDG